MIDRIRTKQANDEGFTLVEMLIVIVVLGILAGITVFGVSTFRSDAQASSCKADVKTVGTAAEAFKAKTGGYPTSIQDDLVDGGYLKAAPGTAVTLSGGKATATCGGTAVSF